MLDGSDESDELPQIDANTKYIILQNNHRRLLGVTTALTEALECSVRGDQFDLEETLNRCIKIYPELFNYIRKPNIKNVSKHKLYNTSVSEDAGTDVGSFHIINELPNFSYKHQYINNQKQSKTDHQNLKTDTSKSSTFINSERDASGNSSRFNSGTNKSTHLPKINIKKSMLDNGDVSSNFGDASPFIILTPEYKVNHFNLANKNANESKRESVSENHDVVDESTYVVKLPDSDTDLSNKADNEKDVPKSNTIIEDVEQKNNENQTGAFWPYEIIVQQTLSPRNDRQNSDGNLFIQIKPEHAQENNNNYNEAINKHLQSNVQTQTIITRPLETCIIITKHVESSVNPLNENLIDSNKSEEKQKVKDDLECHDTKNVTMDKLQLLSTGLKVQSNEMESKKVVKEVLQKKVAKSDLNVEYPRGMNNEFCGNVEPLKESSTQKYFVSLKDRLINGTVKERSSILQTLRLTLIHTLAKERAAVMSSYVENDILNINKDVLLIHPLLPQEIVNGWDLILQQMLLKFLNTMCSIYKGRDYLTINTKIMSSLVNYFFLQYGGKSDSISQDMLMAVFHKLCTRQNQQPVLVNSGVVEKIFYNILESHNSMSQYRLKHSLGILINLSVYSAGRNILEPMSSEMLTLIVLLLKKYDKKIIPYVARLIYVLMANEKFHKSAKEVDLLALLEKTIDVSNKRLKLQLDVLKSVIDHPQPYEYLYGTEENFLSNIEAEMDELEEEVEIAEPSLSQDSTDIYGKIKTEYQMNDEKPIKQVDAKKSILPIKSANKPKVIVNKKSNKSALPKLIKNDNVESEKPKVQPKLLKKRTVPLMVSKIDKPVLSKSKSFDKSKLKKQESVRNADDSLTYVILKDTFEGVNKDVKKSDRKLAKYSISAKNSEGSASSIENLNNDDKSDVKMDNSTSFVVLSENDSNKSMSIDLNMSSTSESLQSAEQVELPSDIVKTSEMLESMSETLNIDNSKYLLNNDGSHFVSLFIQHGKVTEIEYDYCEDTKEIQSPINYDNMFKDNRQSPYTCLLTESRKFKDELMKANKNEVSSDECKVEVAKLESDTSTENSDVKK